MPENIRVRQIHSTSLACEPILRRTANGELLCIVQCGGTTEPSIHNRVYAFHSKDNGESWSKRESIYPEDGQAVYCTEVSVDGGEITAYLTVHSGRFLDWKCFMMKSFDNGYTWKNYGSPPHFPEYTFIRGRIERRNGDVIIPYQYYPVSKEEHDRVLKDETITDKVIWKMKVPYCEAGVLISTNHGRSYDRFPAARFDLSEHWSWAEPTVAELPDGTLVMLMRRCKSGCLWTARSLDGGKTWSETVKCDIPNPSNKPKLIMMGDRIALLHTPNPTHGDRNPLALWISDDGMKTWESKTVLSDFPGRFCYCDGIYENGHILFTVEHNRHTVLFFDVTLP